MASQRSRVLRAVATAEIRARVSGTLEQIFFEPSAVVKKGDVLFEIERRTYQAAYDEAVARGELRLDSQVRGRRRTGAAREIANPLARVYLASGREKFEAGDLAGAQMDAELGLSLERAPALEALHTEVVRSMVRPGATSS